MISAIAIQVASPDEKQSQGVQLYEEGRYEEAFAVLGEALRQSKDAPWHLWNDWSATAFACGQMEKAEAGLKHALALNEKSSEVRANLGGLLVKLNRHAEALPYLEEASAQSAGPHRIAITQLLAACRGKQKCEGPTQPHNHVDFSPSPDGNFQDAREFEPDQYWFPDITGWFLEEEALHLFAAVQLARPKRILEIGTFYGRSTATICSAIKSLRVPVEFITCDLDFSSEEEFKQLFAAIHNEAKVCLPVACHEAFAVGVSTLTYAQRELARKGLESYARFEAGDFRRIPGTFDLIFADVLHDLAEIEKNLPSIVDKLRDDGILAVHDLTEEYKIAIRHASPEVRFISQHAHLGLYRIERCPRKNARITSPSRQKVLLSR